MIASSEFSVPGHNSTLLICFCGKVVPCPCLYGTSWVVSHTPSRGPATCFSFFLRFTFFLSFPPPFSRVQHTQEFNIYIYILYLVYLTAVSGQVCLCCSFFHPVDIYSLNTTASVRADSSVLLNRKIQTTLLLYVVAKTTGERDYCCMNC